MTPPAIIVILSIIFHFVQQKNSTPNEDRNFNESEEALNVVMIFGISSPIVEHIRVICCKSHVIHTKLDHNSQRFLYSYVVTYANAFI